MMKATHTPGPWTIEYGPASDPERLAINGPSDQQVVLCSMQDEDGDVDEANARLIAAAPDLLEALRYYVELHERWRMEMPERNENDGKAWERTRKIALDAIGKATAAQRATFKVSADPKYAVPPFAKPGEEN